MMDSDDADPCFLLSSWDVTLYLDTDPRARGPKPVVLRAYAKAGLSCHVSFSHSLRQASSLAVACPSPQEILVPMSSVGASSASLILYGTLRRLGNFQMSHLWKYACAVELIARASLITSPHRPALHVWAAPLHVRSLPSHPFTNQSVVTFWRFHCRANQSRISGTRS